jgi:hypothetical protein
VRLGLRLKGKYYHAFDHRSGWADGADSSIEEQGANILHRVHVWTSVTGLYAYYVIPLYF